MSKERIEELIAELSAELDNTPELEDELRDEVEGLQDGIAKAFDPEDDKDHESLMDDAIALEARFAATHPVAEKIIRELVNTLSRIGI